VAQKLALQWSPEQISGWLKQEFPTDRDMQSDSNAAIIRASISAIPCVCFRRL
jgi:hypothetical protein